MSQQPGNEPELSVVIVNYNGGKLLANCLSSLRDHPASCSMEIVVVDNASTDDSGRRVAEDFPEVRLARETTNLGLAKAINRGLRIVRGQYLLSLDNDTRVMAGALDALVDFLRDHPDAGAVGSRLYNPDQTPQRTARRTPGAMNAIFGRRSIVTKLFPNNRISRRYLMADQLDATKPFEVGWVSTAALMVRRDVLNTAGALDEDFFVYWVDADWCARIRRAGWAIYCEPRSAVIHDENLAGRGRRSRRRPRMVVDFHRGAYLYYRKNHAPGRFHPMAAVALCGLSLRAGAILAMDRLSGMLAPQIEKMRSDRGG